MWRNCTIYHPPHQMLQLICGSCIRSLQMLGVQGSQYGVLLTPLVLGKLPMECRLEWARNSVGKEGDLDFLLSSLQEELKRRDHASCYTSRTHESTSRAQLTPTPLTHPRSYIDQPLLHCTVRLQLRLFIVCCAVDLIPYLNVLNFYNCHITGEETNVVAIDCGMPA